MTHRHANRFLSRFRQETDGSATVETVLWLPLFFAMIALVMDASMAFHAQARALRIVQDTNRALAVGRIETPTQARDIMLARIGQISPSATAVTMIQGDIVASEVTMPIGDLIFFIPAQRWGGYVVRASSQQLLEM